MERIIIDISPQAETQIEVNGVKGKRCQDVTRDLERALGKTVSDKKTAEYHQAEHTGQRQGAHGQSA